MQGVRGSIERPSFGRGCNGCEKFIRIFMGVLVAALYVILCGD